MNRQKMLMLQDSEKKWYKQRARLWAKGRKLARENIKALKNQFEASEDPITLAAFDPGDTSENIYRVPSQQLRLVILTYMVIFLLMR